MPTFWTHLVLLCHQQTHVMRQLVSKSRLMVKAKTVLQIDRLHVENLSDLHHPALVHTEVQEEAESYQDN
jgi:hypothetical protein